MKRTAWILSLLVLLSTEVMPALTYALEEWGGGELDNSSVLVYVVDDAPEVVVEDTEPIKYNPVKIVNWEDERTQLIEDGNTIDEPSIEEKEWYNFLWWYSDKSCENKFDFNSSITRDITIYACRKAIYTVSFDQNYYWEEGEWTSLWEVQAEEWTTITPVSDPEREDYNFLWWAKEDECKNIIDFSEKEIKENFTVYACWEEIPSYYVKSYDKEWGAQNTQKIYVWNTAVPYMTTNESWCKAIWQRDWEEYDFSTPVTEDIELHVVWDCDNKVDQVQKVEDETAEEWTWDNAQWWSSSNDTIQEITYNVEEITWEVTYAGVTVSVVAPIGSFPENTELVIKPIETIKEIKKVQDALVEQVEEIDNSTFMVSFDISFLDPETKEELQPSNDKTVEVTFNYEENSRLKESDTNDDITLKVYHLEDKDEAWNKLDEVEVKEIVELKNDVEWEVTIDAEKFSTYTVVLWNETPELEATLVWDDSARNAFKYRTITITWDDWTRFVLMDRNLWARVAWNPSTNPFTTNNTTNYDSENDYYGYYYQWWNNYGFSAKTTAWVNWPVTVNSDQMPSKFSSSTWIKTNPWDNWSSSNNYNYDLWWNVTNTDQARQWPCPNWWHVPSRDEWVAIRSAWCQSKWYSASCSNGQEFAEALLLPTAGYRYYSVLGFLNRGSSGYYWSSTPNNANYACNLSFNSSYIGPQDSSSRSYGFSVRCVQSSPTWTVTFTANWETFKSVDVKRWSTVSQPSPAPTTSNGTFQGWYLTWATTAFNFSTAITADTELFAKFTCNSGYQLADDWSGCEEISYTVTYDKTENWWEWENEQATVWYNWQADLTKTATKEWYDFLWWNTDKNAHVGLTVSQDTTLYAIFSKTVTITFDANWSAWSNQPLSCTMYNTATTCPIEAPSITVSAGWTAIGYDDDQNGHTNEWTVGTSKNVSEDDIYYAQTKKAAINYSVSFNENWATSLSSNSEPCTVPEVWNWGLRSETCNVTAPTITRDWWTKLWFNTSASATTSTLNQWASLEVSSANNWTTYYAITKKEAVNLTANVDGNNSTLSSNDQLQCTLSAVYNTNTQATYCDVEMPTVTNTKTPELVWWNIVANTDVNNSAYTIWTNKLRLTTDNTNTTWYAITTAPEKPLTITYWMWVWVSEIWKTSDSCTIAATYNGAEQDTSCTVTAPTITVMNGYSDTNKKWIDQSETTTQVAPWATITLTSDKHLSASAQYRAWSTPISYSITYHLDGGIQEWWKDSYTVEDDTFTLVNPTKEHYSFAWWTGTDLTAPTQTVTIEKWTKYKNLEYTATWNADTDTNHNGIADEDETFTVTISAGDYWTVNKTSISKLYGVTITVDNNTVTIGDESVTATPLADTDEFDYEFVNWTNTCNATLTNNCTLTANFSRTTNEYLIQFVDWNDTVLKSENVAYWTVPTAPADPTRENTAQYTYTFAGWDSTVAAVTWPKTYKATYDSTVNTYTITWKNYDGTTLETDNNVAYWATPTYNSSTPEKSSTADHTYSFAGWSPAITTVQGDKTYTASFTEHTRQYTVRFLSETWVVLSSAEYDYNTPANEVVTPGIQTKESTVSQTFSFDGWNVTAVTADADYTASFTAHPRQYSVTFVDEDGTTILKAATNYDYGTLPENIVQPDNLTKQNYVFAEWTPALAEVTADATYTASWYEDMNNDGQPDNTEDKYSVTYTDGVDWEEIFANQTTSNILSWTATPEFSGTPTRTNYLFNWWTPTVADKVTANATYTATWKLDSNNNWVADENETYTLTINYVYAKGWTASESYSVEVLSWVNYSKSSPEVTNYHPNTVTVTWVMPWDDVEVTVTYYPNTDANHNNIADQEESSDFHTLRIHYWNTKDGEVYPDHVASIVKWASYDVSSTAKDHYTIDKAKIEWIMWEEDITEIVRYTPDVDKNNDGIADSYESHYTLTIHYQNNHEWTITGDYTAQYVAWAPYSVPSPVTGHYTANIATVSWTMPADNHSVTVVYTPDVDTNDNGVADANEQHYTLRIHYVNAKGWKLYDDYVGSYVAWAHYEIPSSTSDTNYTIESWKETVEWNMPSNNTEITVTYTAKNDLNGNGIADEVEAHHTLTIHYINTKWATLFADYVASIVEWASYNIPSTAKDHYTIDKPIVSWIMGTSNVEETVTYSTTTEDTNNNGIADEDETPNTLTITYNYSRWGQASSTVEVQYLSWINYSITSPIIAHYNADKTVVEWVMWENDINVEVVYTPDVDKNNDGYADALETKYTATVHYVYSRGWEAHADNVEQDILSGLNYSIVSPIITHYVASKQTVSWTITGVNVEETIVYTPINDENHDGYADEDEIKYSVIYTDGVEWEVVFANQVTSNILSWTVTPEFSGTPTRTNYIFGWWTPSVAAKVTANATYTATWKEDMNNNGIDDATEEKHTITIKDGETILATIELISWVVISLPTPPVKDWYTFDGWDWLPADGKAIDENLTITAKWKKVETIPVDNTPRAWGGGGGRIVSNNTTSTTTTTNEHGSAEEKTSDDKNTSDNLNTNLDSENTEKTTSPVDSNIESNEVTDAYTWAHKNRITTMPSIEEATPEGYVKRWHLAKMLVNYSVNVLWKEIPTIPKECKNWSDDRDFESAEIRDYAEKACALWLMWVDTENHKFNPNQEVTRAQFGTTISRMLYGDKYQWGFPYYEKHLKALNENNIMKNIVNPQDRIELRKWVWVMLQRIQEKQK